MTNNDNPLKITADDRRFCGIECYNAICNDKDYFNALKKEIDSGDYDKSFYDFICFCMQDQMSLQIINRNFYITGFVKEYIFIGKLYALFFKILLYFI